MGVSSVALIVSMLEIVGNCLLTIVSITRLQEDLGGGCGQLSAWNCKYSFTQRQYSESSFMAAMVVFGINHDGNFIVACRTDHHRSCRRRNHPERGRDALYRPHSLPKVQIQRLHDECIYTTELTRRQLENIRLVPWLGQAAAQSCQTHTPHSALHLRDE